jgi:hypothetical protein
VLVTLWATRGSALTVQADFEEIPALEQISRILPFSFR